MMRTRWTEGWTTARATVARRLFIDRQAAFWRRELRDARARVVEVIAETADTRTFVLEPHAGWRRHRAGQHTTIEVEIDGVRLRRCYSISSAPDDPRVAITVKRQRGGRVSGWLHDHLRAGDRVALAAAAGRFVLPSPRPEQLLFVSGGSGMTPIMSMLRQLASDDALDDVILVHYARRRDDVIFGDELEAMASRGLRLVFHYSDGGTLFDEARLATAVPDFAARATFLCGPLGLMERVDRMWQAAGAAERLRRERFGGVALTPAASDARVEVRLERSGRRVSADPARPLLDQLEAAGVRPPFGCRIGVCHTCQCTKRSGTVENLLTGALSTADDDEIQLCISAPRTDVELGL